MSYSKLLFGTAGVPIKSKGRSALDGIAAIHDIGLDALEIEFVYGVYMKESEAKKVKELKDELKINLTVHGPYYINLNAIEDEKLKASRQRILESAKIAGICGADSLTFHAGFYLKQEPDEVYSKIKSELESIVGSLKEKDIALKISPELTGKGTQFGSLTELVRLAQEINGLGMCIDFSHYHARENGKYNSFDEWNSMLSFVGSELGHEYLKDMHIHISGINYGAKGEKNHLNLKDSDLKYKELLAALKENDCAGIVVCESPNLEDDALLLKKTYEKL